MSNTTNKEDEFIFLFDACTDTSREEFEQVKHLLPSQPKIIASETDLFEVKANNAILKQAEREVIALFQDDILLHDPLFKEKIEAVRYNVPNLGLLGGRTGFELSGEPDFPERALDKVSNWEHLENQYGIRLAEGQFAKRTILNRGPIIFTQKLLSEVGYLNEDYFPQWGDDMDYCCRAKFGHDKENIVFQCAVESRLEWGTTHTKKTKVNLKTTLRANWQRFITDWGPTLKTYANLA